MDVDDLDAFFEEVSEAEAKATIEDDQQQPQQQADDDEEDNEPPTKKAKTTSTAPGGPAVTKPLRPLGVVVASSTSVASKRDETSIPLSYNPQTEATNPATTFYHSVFSTPLHHSNLIGTKATVALPSVATAAVITNPPLPQQMPSATPATAATISDAHVKAHKRKAAGKVWVDPTLAEWPENDFRLFVGNLSKDVTDQQLHEHFQKYPSLAKVKVVRDPKNGNSKGFGFCSFLQPIDYAKALREMDQTWLSSRPIRIKRSDWKEHELKNVAKKEKKMFKQR